MIASLRTSESWHQNSTARHLNLLIEQMVLLSSEPFTGRFDINGGWLSTSGYLVYNDLVDYAAENFTYDVLGGKLNNYTDWQQGKLWYRLQGLIDHVNSLPTPP